jgi:ubiquinone/menaquinone biosynthesis C-methylase UbiE
MIATDVSSEMIAIAREKATAQACQNVEFSAATVERAPGSDGTYDAVLAFNLLHLIADLPSALAHVHRLLKPGGLFISKTPCLSEMNLFIRLAVPVMRLVGKAPYVSFFSATELEAEIANAGFTIIERGRHGSEPKDPRIFIVARKSDLERRPDGAS